MTPQNQQLEDSPARQEEVALTLVHLITASIQANLGLREHLAVQFARGIVEGLREHLGGERLYVPMLHADRAARDTAIKTQFNGKNLREICKQHRVARATVYRIVGRRPGAKPKDHP